MEYLGSFARSVEAYVGSMRSLSIRTWIHFVWNFERVGNQVHYIGLSVGDNDYTIDTYYGAATVVSGRNRCRVSGGWQLRAATLQRLVRRSDTERSLSEVDPVPPARIIFRAVLFPLLRFAPRHLNKRNTFGLSVRCGESCNTQVGFQ